MTDTMSMLFTAVHPLIGYKPQLCRVSSSSQLQGEGGSLTSLQTAVVAKTEIPEAHRTFALPSRQTS